ncbi:hypothetical protein [uncultured Dokdonia sp.]|uniref:hypothetical protein n=1 Tax=uncultured Dokdonia sp. TaxID=575653 RepID=UPI002620ED7D|nr:hypothetical protein [uncultured Dokdonia sp.]
MDNQSSGALTLKEILLGITDSLNEAQHKLRNMEPYDEYGRPNTMYQIPYLDFNLQVTSEFESTPQQTSTTAPQSPANDDAFPSKSAVYYKPKMMFRPMKPQQKTSQTSSEVVSTISGRFVATMPNEGVPQIVLRCNYQEPVLQNNIYSVPIEVVMENAAGEKLSGMRVEFNFNEDKTTLVNGTALTTTPSFDAQEVLTNGLGIATNTITIDPIDYNSGKVLFFDINAGTILKKISISKL